MFQQGLINLLNHWWWFIVDLFQNLFEIIAEIWHDDQPNGLILVGETGIIIFLFFILLVPMISLISLSILLSKKNTPIINSNENKITYKVHFPIFGKQYHRIDGPAVEHGHCKEWWVHGQRHNNNGPAIIDDGRIEWYWHGRKLSFSQWKTRSNWSDENIIMFKLKYGNMYDKYMK